MSCSRRRTSIQELSPEDTETLRDLRGAALSGRRYVKSAARAHQTRASATAVAERLEALAESGLPAGAETLRELAAELRGQAPPNPAILTTKADADASHVLNAWLRDAHDYGYTLAALSSVIGVTGERVRQLIADAQCIDGVPLVAGIPQQPEDLPWPAFGIKYWNRWPRPTLTPEERAELLELQQLGKQNRGRVAVDDPRRLASEKLSARLAELMDDRGFKYNEIADVLGVTPAAVRLKLKLHGYRGSIPPSQRAYRSHEKVGAGD